MGDALNVRATELEMALLQARNALEDVAQAAPLFDTIAQQVERAVKLARFETHESEGPFHHADFRGPPRWPRGPLFPRLKDPGAFAGPPGKAVQRLCNALEALQQQLVYDADCQEYVDANNNSRQFLRAAGHLDLAEPHAQALAALVRRP